jgi:hypothetical protein
MLLNIINKQIRNHQIKKTTEPNIVWDPYPKGRKNVYPYAKEDKQTHACSQKYK